MAILTVTQLREHISSGLGNDALQRLLDAAEDDIVEWDGATDAATEHIEGGHGKLVMSRLASSFTSITELADTASERTLEEDDYRLDGYILHRLNTGTNPRYTWDGLVRVVYVPVDDTDARKRDQIDLVKLALAWEGVTSQRVGEFSATTGDYEAQRLAILSRRGGALMLR